LSAAAGLERFVTAQASTFAQALAELQEGEKRSHWMWFIFPQVEGLGRSETARYYGVADIAEARAYLAHPLLGPRLIEATEAMLSWTGKRSAEAILGQVDAKKFRSSMTLFEAAGGGEAFASALDAFHDGKRDENTLALLGADRQGRLP
jgi:uncharacterized protein (DUF1810 family)